jgi:hypothetical protein
MSFRMAALCAAFAVLAIQQPKPLSWANVKHVFDKLKIEYKTARSQAGDEMMLCTYKADGWTFPMDVSLSDDHRVLWIVMKLTAIDDPAKTPPSCAMGLLELNDSIGPSSFSFDRSERRFLLNTQLANNGITMENLHDELDRMLDVLKKSQKLWDQKFWPKG